MLPGTSYAIAIAELQLWYLKCHTLLDCSVSVFVLAHAGGVQNVAVNVLLDNNELRKFF